MDAKAAQQDETIAITEPTSETTGPSPEGLEPADTSGAEGESTPEEAGHAGGDESANGDRRTSSIDEVRDGGYGVGSAAPIEDGALPLAHPVKAWEDTKTYMSPEHEGYDSAEPHVWFTDEGAAARAGFHRAD